MTLSPKSPGRPIVSPDQLAGCRVLVTAQRRAAELGAALERRGATVDHAPVLSVVPHVDDEQLLADTIRLINRPPQIVVVTTGIGLRGWIEAADAAGLGGELVDTLDRSRLIVRGPKARGAVQAAGLVADWVAESETHEEIREMLLEEGVQGKRIAIQHHGAGDDGLHEAFETAGATVHGLVVYRWGPPPDPELIERSIRRTAAGEYDAVVFTSAPGAAEFLRIAATMGTGPELVDAFGGGDVVAAAVGTTTAAPLRTAGIFPLIPDRFRLGALVRALVRELSHRRGLTLRIGQSSELRLLRSAAVLDGEVLALSPANFAVLRRLAQAQGRVVSRAELLEVLPGTASDPHAAEVAISRLREALPRAGLVRTVVKRGYRLDTANV